MKFRETPLILVIFFASVNFGCQPVDGQTDRPSWEPKSNQGDVSFQLTPRGIVGDRFVIDFRVDTHSGDLSEIDLKQAVTLQVGKERYFPTVATSLQGHHAQGSLQFSVIAVPERFAIVITGVRDMEDLRFEWMP